MAIAKGQATRITEEIRAEVDRVLVKHGLTVGKTSTRYGDMYEFKVVASEIVEGPNGVNLASEEALAYKVNAGHLAWYAGRDVVLNPNALGRIINLNGQQFVFLGMKPRSTKYPFLGRSTHDGKTYKLPEVAALELT